MLGVGVIVALMLGVGLGVTLMVGLGVIVAVMLLFKAELKFSPKLT